VELVGARLGDHVDDAAAGAADLGLIAVGVDLELLNGILREAVRIASGSGAAGGLAEEYVVAVGSVHQQRVRRAALAAEGEVAGARGVAHNARREHGEVQKVAAVDREIGNLAAADGGAGL
jgi:hypothetical protein